MACKCTAGRVEVSDLKPGQRRVRPQGAIQERVAQPGGLIRDNKANGHVEPRSEQTAQPDDRWPTQSSIPDASSKRVLTSCAAWDMIGIGGGPGKGGRRRCCSITAVSLSLRLTAGCCCWKRGGIILVIPVVGEGSTWGGERAG
jgi:hypothetical protein